MYCKYKVSFLLPDETRREYEFKVPQDITDDVLVLVVLGVLYNNGWSQQDNLDWAVFFEDSGAWKHLMDKQEII